MAGKVDRKVIDLRTGENFDPEYIKIVSTPYTLAYSAPSIAPIFLYHITPILFTPVRPVRCVRKLIFPRCRWWYLWLGMGKAPNATIPALATDGKVYDSTKSSIEWMVEHSSVKVAPGSSLVDKLHEDALDPNFAFVASVRP